MPKLRALKLAGPARDTARGDERVPMNVHPDVRDDLRNLLFEPEMRAVGYSEFLARAVAACRQEIDAQRLRHLEKEMLFANRYGRGGGRPYSEAEAREIAARFRQRVAGRLRLGGDA